MIPIANPSLVGLLVVTLLGLAGCRQADPSARQDSDVVQLTDATFADVALNPDNITLVDFAADWCAPCQRMEPHLEKIATEMKGRALVARIDVDDSQQTAKNYSIYSIPTLIVFKNGEETIRRTGYSEPHAIAKLLESQLNAPNDKKL